jgi:hypothetical protein
VIRENELAKRPREESATAMDYSEHEKTYNGFLWLVKWSVIHVVALLVAMAAGFFGGMGWPGGLLIFIALMAAAFFLV